MRIKTSFASEMFGSSGACHKLFTTVYRTLGNYPSDQICSRQQWRNVIENSCCTEIPWQFPRTLQNNTFLGRALFSPRQTWNIRNVISDVCKAYFWDFENLFWQPPLQPIYSSGQPSPVVLLTLAFAHLHEHTMDFIRREAYCFCFCFLHSFYFKSVLSSVFQIVVWERRLQLFRNQMRAAFATNIIYINAFWRFLTDEV